MWDFSIIADEVRDCSNTEQLSLILRYVDSNCQVKEEFVKFIECDAGTSGAELSDKIIKAITDLGLDISNIRGQGYDGAGNMSGSVSGVSSRILQLNKEALYVHCFNHRLNLTIGKSCGVQRVRNMMEIIKQVSYFINLSPKEKKN